MSGRGYKDEDLLVKTNLCILEDYCGGNDGVMFKISDEPENQGAEDFDSFFEALYVSTHNLAQGFEQNNKERVLTTLREFAWTDRYYADERVIELFEIARTLDIFFDLIDVDCASDGEAFDVLREFMPFEICDRTMVLLFVLSQASTYYTSQFIRRRFVDKFDEKRSVLSLTSIHFGILIISNLIVDATERNVHYLIHNTDRYERTITMARESNSPFILAAACRLGYVLVSKGRGTNDIESRLPFYEFVLNTSFGLIHEVSMNRHIENPQNLLLILFRTIDLIVGKSPASCKLIYSSPSNLQTVFRSFWSDRSETVDVCLAIVVHIMRNSGSIEIISLLAANIPWSRLAAILTSDTLWRMNYVALVKTVSECEGGMRLLMEKEVFEGLIEGFCDYDFEVQLRIGSIFVEALRKAKREEFDALMNMNVVSVFLELLNLDTIEVIDTILSLFLELCDRFEKEVGVREAIVAAFEKNNWNDVVQHLDLGHEKASLLCDRLGLTCGGV
jgi:hypothetical protein